jgi:Polysaccharide biosynthesis/export protein
MLTTMRMARLWKLWLAVLAIGAVVPAWALAAGRVLTPQDSISIKVVNQPDMDTTTRVETDGTISFPYVGRIRAAGLSEDQLAHAIERQLASRQIVTDPHVLVDLWHPSERPRAGGGARSVHTRPANKSHPTPVTCGGTAGYRPGWNRVCAPRRRRGPEV